MNKHIQTEHTPLLTYHCNLICNHRHELIQAKQIKRLSRINTNIENKKKLNLLYQTSHK